ncbi:DUF6134 family protein [Hyphomonas oceanitis]|uniref:DUF6134 family protein n=1 Tax=Hyphomonas oceanitis TaxID=81033 RepID=UPI00300342B7
MIRYALTTVALSLLLGPAWADNIPASGPGLVTENPWQPQDGDRIAFDVLRKGKPFGTHTVSFAVEPNGTLKATTDVRLKAGLGPITVFHYELDATETWKDGTLVALKGAVDDNGKDGSVSAVRAGDELEVNGTEYTGEAPLGILPSSHWNFAQTQAKELLSTEDGELLKVKVIDKGMDTVTVAGKPVDAHHYLMDSAIDVDLWYDDQGRWVKLSFVARDQQIDYVLTQPY